MLEEHPDNLFSVTPCAHRLEEWRVAVPLLRLPVDVEELAAVPLALLEAAEPLPDGVGRSISTTLLIRRPRSRRRSTVTMRCMA